MKSLSRRSLFALLWCAAAAQAQVAPRPLAVVSEIGHDVGLVHFRESTGSLINQNVRSKLGVQPGVVDKVALAAARRAIEKAVPGAPLFVVAPIDELLFKSVQDISAGQTLPIPADLAAAFAERRAAQFVLISRHRADTRLSAGNSVDVGSGQLEGVGLYVDTQARVHNVQARETGYGFIAPYVHARVTLVEAGTGRVLRSQRITTGYMIALPGSTLNANDYLRQMGELLSDEIEQAVATLFAPG